MLDEWAHKWTPFLNMLSWGPETGALQVEWLTEHLGYGYVRANTAIASGSLLLEVVSSDISTTAEAVKQLNSGCMLLHYNSTHSEIALILVDTICGDGTVVFEMLLHTASADMSIVASDKLWIVGSLVGEGSDPLYDTTRARAQITNNMAIIRKDVQITGSMLATDMYAVPNELKHQLRLRLLEMQKAREMLVLFSISGTRSSTVAGAFNGYWGFLKGQSGNHIKQTSMAFTENTVNDVAAELYENGATPNVLLAATSQIRKFTDWNRDRIRTAPDKKMGGSHVTYYLTDTGQEVKLIPMRKFPTNFAFMTDTDMVKLRAKKGRKLIIEKLGKAGDYDRWQLISEFSLELRKYNQGCHGMWTKLNT